MSKYLFKDIVLGEEGLLKGPFGSDLKKSLYVPKGDDTYKVYLQENILKEDNTVGDHYISKQYYNEKMSRYEVKENDFIVTCDGTLGEIFQIKNITEKGIISSSLLRITLNNEIVDDDYFYYLFKVLIKKELITQGNNSVLKHLPGLNVIRNHPIYLPDLYKQKRIGRILKLIDTKIRNNDKINSELESMAKTIYDYWFVQFEFPNEDGKPYKSSGGKMVWNEELKKEIPEGWEINKINDGVKYIIDNRGKNPSSYYTKEEYPVIDNYLIKNTPYPDISKVKRYINKNLFDNFLRTYISKNDIIITLVGNGIGNVSLAPSDQVCIIQNTIGFRCNNRINSYYFYFYLKSNNPLIRSLDRGSSQPSIKLSDILHLKMLFPNNDVLQKFEKISIGIFDKILFNYKENQELTKLRDFLLPLLMNGQVGFKEDIGDEIRSKDIEEKELISK